MCTVSGMDAAQEVDLDVGGKYDDRAVVAGIGLIL